MIIKTTKLTVARLSDVNEAAVAAGRGSFSAKNMHGRRERVLFWPTERALTLGMYCKLYVEDDFCCPRYKALFIHHIQF